MDFEFKPLTLDMAASAKADALVVLWPDSLPSVSVGSAGAGVLEWIHKLVKAGELETGVGKLASATLGSQCVAGRLVVVRAGDGSAAAMRKASLAAAATLRAAHVKKVLLFTGFVNMAPGGIRAAALAFAEATYAYTTTLSKGKPRSLKHLVVAQPDAAAIETELAQASGVLSGIELAKEWANRPANHATPSMLADAAQKLDKLKHMRVDVLGPKEVAELGMGAFMAVAQGSHEPLRFIVIRYNGGSKHQAPVALVGKGITFDTGGISIKPAPEMDEMKFDMGGAASVLGAMQAIGELQPPVNVVAVIPSCENMPDGRAIKPGDVVTSMSGQTIEILNTDAEGRLILCDALTYVAKLKPSVVIDVATLTGACVIALGHVRTGLFSASAQLAEQLMSAGESAQDPCWRMPLDDEYGEGLKSNFADMANVAGRPGGAVSAAKFLQKFVGELNWAHLDIAGTAWKSGAGKGSTGRPVGLLVQFVLDEAARLSSSAKSGGKAPKAASAAK
jgi:leucyl aminopeptidase